MRSLKGTIINRINEIKQQCGPAAMLHTCHDAIRCRDSLLNFLTFLRRICAKKMTNPSNCEGFHQFDHFLFQMGQRSVSILPESNITPENRSFHLDCLTIGHPKRKFYPSNHWFSFAMLTSCGRKLIFLWFPSPAWQGWSNPVNSARSMHNNITCICDKWTWTITFWNRIRGMQRDHYLNLWYDYSSEFLQYLIRIDFGF